MPTDRCPDKSVSQDKAVQCELLLDNLEEPTREFNITNVRVRRRLVRRFYLLLMLQYALSIPCIEVCLLYSHRITELHVQGWMKFVYFICFTVFYALLYKYRTWRRASPFNYLMYLVTSIITAIDKCVYLLPIDLSRWAHLHPLMIIVELMVLLLYTKQQRFKFSHAIGVIIIFVVFGLMLLFGYFLGVLFKLLKFYTCTLQAWYTIYDTHKMLCDVHGYNLQANEYTYAATNIHADKPKFIWTVIKYFSFGPFREMRRLLRSSRSNQIC